MLTMSQSIPDDLFARTQRALQSRSASERDVDNLRGWVSDFGCISREEAAYLWKDDLMAAGPSEPDTFLEAATNITEDCLIRFSSWLGKVSVPA